MLILFFGLFFRIRVLSTLNYSQINFDSIFVSKYKIDGPEYDYQIFIYESPPAYNSKFQFLGSVQANFPDLKFFSKPTISNKKIFIGDFPGSLYLKSILLENITDDISNAEFEISPASNLTKIPFPPHIKELITTKTYPLFLSGDPEISSILKCSPISQKTIANFPYLATILLISYVTVVLLTKRKQPKRFYTLTKEPQDLTYPISEVSGISFKFYGKIIREIIRGINMCIPYEIEVSAQHSAGECNLSDKEPTPKTFFNPSTNQAIVENPIVLGKEILNVIISRDPNQPMYFDPLMTSFCHFYLIISLYCLNLSSKKSSISSFIQNLLQSFDLNSLYFYRSIPEVEKKERIKKRSKDPTFTNEFDPNDGIEVIFQEYRRNKASAIVKEDLSILPTTFFEKSTIIIREGQKYYLSKTEVGGQSFIISVAIDENNVSISCVEEYFRRFFVFTLAFWYLTSVKNNDEASSKNYISMVRSSHAFTMAEYFDDLTQLSLIGELEKGSTLFDFFTEEQKQEYRNDLIQLRKTGEPITQKQYMVQIHNSRKWFSLCARISFDSYYNRNVILCLFEDVSHLHKIESQIQETYNDLSLTSQLLSLHKFTQDDNGIFMLENTNMLKKLGYNEIGGSKNLLDYAFEEDRNQIRSLKESEKCTVRFMNKNNECQWWTVVCTSTEPAKGFAFSVQESTELQSKMKSTKDYFEMVSTTNAFAFWAINLDPNMPRHIVFTTITYHDLLKHTHMDFHDLLALDKLKSLETPVTLEVQLKLDNMNALCWFSLTLIPIGGKQLLCFAFNIDERKKTHDLLRETQQLLDLAFTYSDAKMWVFEDRADHGTALESGQMIMDWSTLHNDLEPDYRDKALQAFRDALSGVTEKLEIEVPFLFDNHPWLLMRGTRTNEHKLVGVCIDTTAIKNTSQELEKQKKAALEASQSKSLFLANMTHELKTPITGIFGSLGLLQGTEMSPEFKEITNCVQNSFMELWELLNDTLDLAKLESHKMIPLSDTFDPCEDLSMIQDNIFSQKRKPNVQFRIFTDPKTPILVHGNPHGYIRIISNLLSNSSKFTEIGYIDLHIKVLENETDETEESRSLKPILPCLFVQIKDTGSGINEERLQNIREHFAHGEMMAVYEHTCVGVGLSLVTEMIRFMQGTIGVSSEVDNGTTFSFKIPIEPVYFPIASCKRLNSNISIVLVGCDPGVCEMIQQFSLFYGIKTVSRIDAERFKLLCRDNKDQFPYQIIIADYDDIQDFSIIPKVQRLGVLMKNVPETEKINEVLNLSPNNTSPAGQTHIEQYCYINVFSKPLNPAALRDFLTSTRFKKDSSAPAKQIKVLAAEDDKIVQAFIGSILKKLHCEYKIVSNGQEAVDEVQKDQYDIVLMDQDMPILDGSQATMKIRELGGHYQMIPIISMSANDLPENQEKSRQAGMTGYVGKPVTIQALSKVFDRYCGRR